MVPRGGAGYLQFVRRVPREDDVSMWTPMEPDLGRGDDGIPAADPGAGAPPPADGFGIGGEEPDRPNGAGTEDVGPQDADAHGTEDGPDDDPPFRTPDPGEVGRS
jgi:hypothetical protein